MSCGTCQCASRHVARMILVCMVRVQDNVEGREDTHPPTHPPCMHACMMGRWVDGRRQTDRHSILLGVSMYSMTNLFVMCVCVCAFNGMVLKQNV